MLEQPIYAWTGTDAELRALVAAHPWVTMISSTTSGLVVSHLPILPGSEGTDILGHLAREDAERHELGQSEVVVVVEGPHGYISAGWYVGGPYVSTWNFVVAHLHGRPRLLDAEQTYDVLDQTMQHFESARPEPFALEQVSAYAHRIAPYVSGFRLRPTRVVAKTKLSQDKPAADVAAVLRGLEDSTDVHSNYALAVAMRTNGIPT